MSSQNSDPDDRIFTLEYANAVPTLSKAAKVGDLQTVKKLISQGKLPQTPDNRGWTPIHCCVAANQLQVLKLILKLKSKNKKYLVNLLTWEKESPLILALKSKEPNIDVVKLLLKSGANPNQKTHTNLTPLHIACMLKGNLIFVKLLVQYGADVNIQEDLTASTPLHFAISEAQDLDIVKYLITLCDLTLENSEGRNAFSEACSLNFLEAVAIFIEKDKTLANLKSERPPLLYACLWGNYKMTELLINSGADAHCKCEAVISNKPGESDFFMVKADFFPIHSSFNNVDVFKLLLKHTDPAQLLHLENKYYNFPLFVLMFSSNCSCFEALLQSDFPEELKTINCSVFLQLSLSCVSFMEPYILKSMPLLFKYNFYLEPENVFPHFVCQLSSEEICTHFKIFHFLALIGVSSEDEFDNKRTVVGIFENFIANNGSCENSVTLKSICDLLSESVLSLKQYCRIALRRKVRSVVNTDWQAYKVINESGLPECLKKFLFFEQFR